ncbi:hypothetical protein N431DRAFT_464439 [Stipitochalara longipes BDJ]|nr:hypothetical protein N431DRAFT_464439 [Stipitochalara longipes BDJ]
MEYARLEDTEKHERSSSEFESHDVLLAHGFSNWSVRQSIIKRYWPLIAHSILLLLNLGGLLLLWSSSGGSIIARQKACGKLLGQWLPGWEDGVIYKTQQFIGSFNHQTPFTGVGPEVDAAWGNITDAPTGGAIGITKEQWEEVNPFHEWPVMLEEDHGTGRYLASLDVFHQLHCVDLLRKSIHREYYNEHEGSFAGAPEAVVMEHCVETLRQTLMCHGDMSLLTYNWVEGRDMPYPNFNTIHTCKDWDTLVAWNKQRDVTVDWKNGEIIKEYVPPSKPANVKGMWPPP